jgi:hypothetical protein
MGVRRRRCVMLFFLVLLASGLPVAAPAFASAPLGSVSAITPILNPQYQLVSGTTIYVRGTQSGSFRVGVTASDPGGNPGVTFVLFPALGLGWSASPSNATSGSGIACTSGCAGPNLFQATYTWSSGAVSPGTVNVVVRDNLQNTTNVPFSVIVDSTGPTASTIDYLDGPNRDSTVAVSYTAADAGSGIAEWQLERRSATHTAGSCTSWSTWSSIGSLGVVGVDPVSSVYIDSDVADTTCYQYRLAGTDRVGNTATVGSAKQVEIDQTAPIASLEGYSEFSYGEYQYVMADVMYVNPNQYGAFYVEIDAQDTASGIAQVEFPMMSEAFWSGGGGTDTTFPYSSEYSWLATAAAPGTITAVVTDLAGNTSNVTFELQTDGLPPAGGSLSHTSGASTVSDVELTFTDPSDAGTGVASTQLYRRAATYIGGACGTYGEWASIGDPNPVSPFTDTLLDDNTCYQYRLVAVDNVGNELVIGGPAALRVDRPNFTYPFVTQTVASVPVTVDTGAYGGLDIVSWRLERSVGTRLNNACTTSGVWSQVGGANPGLAYTDTAVVHGSCYEYRLITVDSLNAETTTSGPGQVGIDTQAPATSITTTGPVAGTTSIEGTAVDEESTVVSLVLAYAGASNSGTICTVPVPLSPWSCSWNTSAVAGGTYTVTATTTDGAGNVSTAQRSIVVDNEGPVSSLHSLTPVTGTSFQHVSGSTIYVNTNESGSFTARVNASDGISGIQSVNFPDLDGAAIVWTPAGSSDTTAPYETTYGWTPGAASPGTVQVTAYDQIGASSTVSFTVTGDGNPPLGATVSYANSLISTSSTSVTFSTGSDGGSGIGSWQLQRRDATQSGGVCGAFGTWSDVGPASPASPYSDATLGTLNCYQYRVLIADRVGNASIFDNPAQTVVVDRVAPTGTISGDPAGPVSGSVTITGTSADADSGVASISLAYSGPASGSVCTSSTAPEAWSCTFNTASLDDGTYTLSLTATDTAGASAVVATRTIGVDNDDPLISFASFVEGTNPDAQVASGSTMYINPSASGSFTARATASDGFGIANVAFASPGAASWSGGGTDATGPSPYSADYTWTPGAGAIGPVVMTATDAAGRTATAPFSVVADASAPTASMSAPTAPFDFDRTIATAWSGSDTGGAGNVRYTVERAFAGVATGLGDFEAWNQATDTVSTSASLTNAAAGTWCFRVAAVDGVGNTSAASSVRCSAVPLDDDAMTVTGSWRRGTASAAFGGDYRTATTSGSTIRANVRGTRISLIVTRCKGCGKVDVMLGSARLKNDLSLAASSTRRRQLIPVVAGSTVRSGTLRIIVQRGDDPVQIEGLAVSAL